MIAEYLPPRPHLLWQWASQMGIRHAIVNAKPERTSLNPVWDLNALRQIHRELSDAGLNLYGLEGDQFDMSRIKLGLGGRDQDIERFCTMLANMGGLGVRLLCYNFMAQIGWFRSNADVAGCRGKSRSPPGPAPGRSTAARFARHRAHLWQRRGLRSRLFACAQPE